MMESKERFINFVNETQNKPYFSTLYDLDDWRKDREEIANDLKVLDILKKYIKIGNDTTGTSLEWVIGLDNSISLEIMLRSDADVIKRWMNKNE